MGGSSRRRSSRSWTCRSRSRSSRVNASAPIEPDVRATTRTFDGRIYILLLDDLHTNVTRTNNVREVAKKFINEYLGVNDLAAVVYTSGRQESGQELTSNRRLLNAAIDRFQGQKLPSAGAEKLALHRAADRQPGSEFRRVAGDPHARGSAAGAVDPRPVRHGARGQRAAVAGGDRERRPLDGRRPGAPQGAAVLQRGVRLRHLPAVRHRPRKLVARRRGAGSGGGGAARQRQRLRHRPARHEPVRRDDRDQRPVRLSAARLRHLPRPAARAAAGAGEPDFAFRRDRRHSDRELRRPRRRPRPHRARQQPLLPSWATTAIRPSGPATGS